MAHLIITRGLPGSGKSYWARGWAAEKPTGRVVIERDTIRLDVLKMDSTRGTQEQENLVTKLQVSMVENALLSGYDVCVSDTNLPQRRAREWASLAATCRAGFSVQNFTMLPLEICLKQNDLRWGTVKYVPPTVIHEMHKRYLASGSFDAYVQPITIEPVRQYERPENGTEAYIFDIDGTLAIMGDRSPYEWHKVDLDQPNVWVMDIAESMYSDGCKIIIMSGRDSSCRELTEQWLKRWSVPYCALFMRPEDDTRKDSIVKAELFWTHVAPFYNILGVFDDRQQVVDAWRAMGLNCAQVAPGNF